MVTPDSQKVLGFGGAGLFLYDFQTQQEPMKLPLKTSEITAMTSSPDGKTILVGCHGGLISQLDLDLALKSQRHRTGPSIVALSTNGRSLAFLSQRSQLSVWNIETQICERWLTDERLSKIFNSRILISSDSCFVVVASLYSPADNTVWIWDVDADELRELRDRPDTVTALALSPDSKTLLCGPYDGQICAIDVKRGVLRETFMGHTEVIRCIVIPPDGQNFALASLDKTIRIWGLKSQISLLLSSEHKCGRHVSQQTVGCFALATFLEYVNGTLKRSALCAHSIRAIMVVRYLLMAASCRQVSFLLWTVSSQRSCPAPNAGGVFRLDIVDFDVPRPTNLPLGPYRTVDHCQWSEGD
ncbi:WD40 repeat-like protein [Piedraia hortae CBS 480.64]|uniref:WD40 repeat-like protein n=1 Tax=Piedraia hortae CBS 480.64 TaxID=1314780 RepID=A0A6A7BR05_9PEZI|nr:WD40 repeat-like protein [Piedraia hortae CBS 480.64]